MARDGGSRTRPKRPLPIETDLGERLRAGRYRAGRTLADVSAETSISRHRLGRMELGQGGSVAVRHWIEVATVLGVDLFSAPAAVPDRVRESILALAEPGGWRLTSIDGRDIVLDRSRRRASESTRLLLPAERAIVRVVSILTDLGAERDALLRATNALVDREDPERSRGGLLVVARSPANQRRVAMTSRDLVTGLTLFAARWIGVLSRTTSSVPVRPGLLWLAPRGTHLQPMG